MEALAGSGRVKPGHDNRGGGTLWERLSATRLFPARATAPLSLWETLKLYCRG